MKFFTTLFSCVLLLSGVAFADDSTKDVPKDQTTKKQSVYKSSPRLSYHSQESERDKELEKLKPMLNQLGNSSTGIVTPGGAAMSF